MAPLVPTVWVPLVMVWWPVWWRDGVSCVALVGGVLLKMVPGVCRCLPWWGLGAWKWFVGSPVLVALAASGARGRCW